MNVETAYQMLYFSVLIVLAVLIGIMIIRSFIGPRVLDRILSINMIGTLVITSLAISSRLLDESYLTDVALIYAMVSLLTVLVLSAIYLPKEGEEGTGIQNRPERKSGKDGTGIKDRRNKPERKSRKEAGKGVEQSEAPSGMHAVETGEEGCI